MVPGNRPQVRVIAHRGKTRSRWPRAAALKLQPQLDIHWLTNSQHRRLNSQKAWTSGANPITQKSASQTQQNGSVLQAKPVTPVKTPQQKETATPDKHANDRLVFILAAAIVSHCRLYGIFNSLTLAQGTSVTIITKSGDKFEGIFSGSLPDSNETNITISMTRRTHSVNDGQTNGFTEQDSTFVGSGLDFAMTFNVRDVVDMTIPELGLPEAVKVQNGKDPRIYSM